MSNQKRFVITTVLVVIGLLYCFLIYDNSDLVANLLALGILIGVVLLITYGLVRFAVWVARER